MNTFSVSRLALALAFGVTLTACSSTPPDQRPSDQTAPGTSSRPILSAKEAQNFDAQHYFASLTPAGESYTHACANLTGGPVRQYQRQAASVIQQAPVYCRDAW